MLNGFESWLSGGMRSPVCCRYACMVVVQTDVEVLRDGGTVPRPITWALASTADGQTEVSGVWSSSPTGVPDYQHLFADLGEAGLSQVRIVLSADPTSVPVDRLSQFRSIAVPSVLSILRKAIGGASPCDRRKVSAICGSMRGVRGIDDVEGLLRQLADCFAGSQLGSGVNLALAAFESLRFSCSPRFRELVLRIDARAEELHDGLNRALRLQGGFLDESDAVKFVEGALERIQMRSLRVDGARHGDRGLKIRPHVGTVSARSSAGA